ncbi:MAG: 1-acyl-sn-glycerol-3-phosphate acyltransferase [Gemmataceae bacterium]|nr:1-acyl-sn-glycerol-3-phosphate acyltransferase [Gemmataceae bacterium]
MRRLLRVETWIPPFYWGCVTLSRLVLVVAGRWKAEGRANLPATGAVIVVSNHLSNADPPILGAGLARRRVVYMAKAELFRGATGMVARLFGAFPVRRFEADLPAMLRAERVLKRGGVLGMFPEGTRSRTGYVGEPHPGTAVIALRTGATVLPCAIVGTEQLSRPLQLLRRPRISVRVGRPIAVTATRRPTEGQVSELTSRIFAEIKAMLPPRYMPSYTESEGAALDGSDPAGD